MTGNYTYRTLTHADDDASKWRTVFYEIQKDRNAKTKINITLNHSHWILWSLFPYRLV